MDAKMIAFREAICNICPKLSSILNIDYALSDVWCKRGRNPCKNDIITVFPYAGQWVIFTRRGDLAIDEFDFVLAYECPLH